MSLPQEVMLAPEQESSSSQVIQRQDHLQDPLDLQQIQPTRPRRGTPPPPPRRIAPKPPVRSGPTPPRRKAPKPPPRMEKNAPGQLEGMTNRLGSKDWAPWELGGKQGLVGTLAVGTGGFVHSMTGDTNLSLGFTVAPVNGALMYQSLSTWKRGHNKIQEGEKYDDQGMKRMGKEDVKRGKFDTVVNSVSTMQTGSKLAQMSGVVGMGTTFTGLGILGHSLALGESAYKIWKSAGKLYPNTKKNLVSTRGKEWNNRINGREKRKMLLNTVKGLAAAVGIVGGIGLLASNPVGWALGLTIAAGAIGVALGSGKGLNKMTDQFKRVKHTHKILSKEKQDVSENKRPKDDPKGFLKHFKFEKKKGVTKQQRDKLKKLSDEAHQSFSKNAKVAGEMRGALKGGGPSFREDMAMNAKMMKLTNEIPWPKFSEEAKEFADVQVLLAKMGISAEEASSSSGQELLEKKLSAWGD